MKKLILLISLLISSPVYAAVISTSTVSSDISVLNTNTTTITNVINGNIEGSTDGGATVSNIKAASVFDINMGADASPHTRSLELLGNTVDTFSSGTLTQGTFVYSGCIPATDSDLTSDISACVAYVNGYRISKGATSETYTASRDTYVDLSQTGVYTLSAVANGATQPAVAANSARIALVVTSGTAITTVTDLARRSLPGLVVPIDYRSGLVVSKDSATTITVLPGSCEINGSMISKRTTTTLTLGTAGDWAGGVSLAANATYGFVGQDASGNLKLHTTAPTHSNYAVSNTVGKKRYATWSATVYRILGWFYMSGSTVIENASNIKEGDVSNVIQSQDVTTLSGFNSTSMTLVAGTNFYSSGGPINLSSIVSVDAAGGAYDIFETIFARGSTIINGAGAATNASSVSDKFSSPVNIYIDANRPQGSTNYTVYARISGNSTGIRRRGMVIQEL